MKGDTPVTAKNSLDELLALEDQDFVRAAYVTLLGRPADQEGFWFYTQLLRAGERKAAIIARLARSAEAQSSGTDLPRLKSYVRAYQLSNMPVIGWLFSMSRQSEGNSRTDRQLRKIERAVTCLHQDIVDRLALLEVRLRDAPSSRLAGNVAPAPVDHQVPISKPEKPVVARGGFIPA